MERILWVLQSDANNQGPNGIEGNLRWDTINTELANRDMPTLGSNDAEAYDAFSTRWEDPQEGPLLKKFIDRFDGQGVVLKTNNQEDRPQQGGKPTGEVEKMAKRATKLGK